MTRDVWIKVAGYHSVDGVEQEPVITEARGTYSLQGGRHYLRYTEVSAETGHASKALVKCREGFLEVTKKGAIDSTMRFEVGKENVSHYSTPAGDLEIGVLASEIAIAEDARRIVISCRYSLHAMGECLQNSRVEITVIPFPMM